MTVIKKKRIRRPETPTHMSWRAMRQRCSSKNHDSYKHYGELGITVCKRWDSYANFLEDMGPRPRGTTLDRVDPRGNYEKSNCEWATPAEQGRHRRNNRMLTYKGRTQTITDWAHEIGMCLNTLRNRIVVSRLTTEEALTRPVDMTRSHRRKKAAPTLESLTAAGLTYTVRTDVESTVTKIR